VWGAGLVAIMSLDSGEVKRWREGGLNSRWVLLMVNIMNGELTQSIMNLNNKSTGDETKQP
jgi:hypothetical protein